jgi:dolichol-phosphate mannosyltransferase
MDPLSPVSEQPPELLIVMPVYNEQASVRKVVLEWFQEVENWTKDFRFLVIDDGSTDGTAKRLHRLREQLGPRLEVISRENRGHGQSCLQGYRIARERRVPYVFQIDSDGQCDPQYFFRFWRLRAGYDVIYGNRKRRDDGWRRVFASFVVRAFLLTLFRVNCVDANVPYRLMRPAALGEALERIPPDFLLANIALAVLLKKDKRIRHGSVPIHFRERYGGEPSVRMSKFGGKAAELYQQLKGMLAAQQP